MSARNKTPLHQVCGLESIYELEVNSVETEVLEYCPLLTGFVTEKWVGRTEVTEVFVRWGAALTGNGGKENNRTSHPAGVQETEWSGELKNLKDRLNRLATNAGIEDSLDELMLNELDCEENDSSEISAETVIEKREEKSDVQNNNTESRWDQCDRSDIQRNSIEYWGYSTDISEEKSEEEESGIHINTTEGKENSRDISHENLDSSSNESGQTSLGSSGTNSEEEESGIDDSSEYTVYEVHRLREENEKLEQDKYVVPENPLQTCFEERDTKDYYAVPENPLQTCFEKRDTKDYYNTQDKFLSDHNVQLRRRGSKKEKRLNTRPVNIGLLEDWKNLDLSVPIDKGIQEKEKKYEPRNNIDTYRSRSAASVENDDVVILRNSIPLRPRTPYPGVPCFNEQEEGEEKMSRGGWLYAYPDLTKDHIHTFAAKSENGTYWQMPFRHNLFSDLVNSNKSHRDSDGNLDSSSFKHDKAWFEALDADTFAPIGDIYSHFHRNNYQKPYGVQLKQETQNNTSGRLRSASSV